MLRFCIGIDNALPEECSQIGLLDSKRSDVYIELLAVPKHDKIVWQGLHMHKAKCSQSTWWARSDRSTIAVKTTLQA